MNLTTDDIIFLTGANGFIGSHLAEYFSMQGYQVVCGIRQKSTPHFLQTLPVKLEYADITDLDSLILATKGASVVIHDAGKVTDWGQWQDFYDTNVTGTRNVLMACLTNNIKRIITTGSVSCYGEEDCEIPKDEQSPHNPRYPYFLDQVWPSGMNHYRISKTIAVKETGEFAIKHNLNVTVIQPVWVYGEREFSSGFYEYMKFVKSRMPFGPGSTKNQFHVIYVRDLARAFHLAIQHAPNGFNSYIIGNKTVCKQDEIFRLICREMGVKKPLIIPKAIAWPIGFLAELAASLLKMKSAPFLTRARVNMFYDSICYSAQKAEDELSFSCQYSLEDGIKKTVQWYKENQLI
ncbi:MAG: NAD-dependent epimerase/dehydratase family protein [Bacteroidota bacterium]|nr:NAD-dependent epimerase [Odoribacter sp.]MDP3643334.1 NAD-dependent epimerase/dehydratase family protein [Bacteroidota bacterium]